jgi:prophage DNA circulation protein
MHGYFYLKKSHFDSRNRVPDAFTPNWEQSDTCKSIKNEVILAKSIKNYTKHESTILGLIKTKQNFWLLEKTMTPLWRMVQATLNTPAKIKMVTSSCYKEHTARNLNEPGGVCQLLLGKILSLHKQSGSNDLGHWVWQQLCINSIQPLP